MGEYPEKREARKGLSGKTGFSRHRETGRNEKEGGER